MTSAAPPPAVVSNTTPATVPLENDNADHDSSIGSDDGNSDFNYGSIASSIYHYRKENGRTYHAYSDGKYLVPNDEREQERMDMLYHSLLLMLEGKAFLSPVKNPQRILDVGTGTGIWALDVGDQYPEAHVIGIDLSPIQPKWVSPNVEFRVDDLEMEWIFESQFDLINSRLCTGNAIKNYPEYLAEAFKHVKPGGWVEGQEFYFDIVPDDNTLPASSHVKRWHDLMVQGVEGTGSRCRILSGEMKAMYEEAGFVNISIVDLKWPVAPWPTDKRLKEAGAFVMMSMLDGIMGVSLAVFTRLLGWSLNEIELFLVDVRKDWKTTGIHAYWPCYVISGQKPVVE